MTKDNQMINKRLWELSCNQGEFNKAKPLYEEALSESNYKTSLQFESLNVTPVKI